jgi:hypothetical protein
MIEQPLTAPFKIRKGTIVVPRQHKWVNEKGTPGQFYNVYLRGEPIGQLHFVPGQKQTPQAVVDSAVPAPHLNNEFHAVSAEELARLDPVTSDEFLAEKERQRKAEELHFEAVKKIYRAVKADDADGVREALALGAPVHGNHGVGLRTNDFKVPFPPFWQATWPATHGASWDRAPAWLQAWARSCAGAPWRSA